jgi:hypothetical protein
LFLFEEGAMEPAIEDLMAKVKTIAQGPNAELLLKLVDFLYEKELSPSFPSSCLGTLWAQAPLGRKLQECGRSN